MQFHEAHSVSYEKQARSTNVKDFFPFNKP